jgi:hypothetical protein
MHRVLVKYCAKLLLHGSFTPEHLGLKLCKYAPSCQMESMKCDWSSRSLASQAKMMVLPLSHQMHHIDGFWPELFRNRFWHNACDASHKHTLLLGSMPHYVSVNVLLAFYRWVPSNQCSSGRTSWSQLSDRRCCYPTVCVCKNR